MSAPASPDANVAECAIRAIEYVERLATLLSLDDVGLAFLEVIAPIGLTSVVLGVAAGPLLATGRRFFFIRWPGDWLQLYEHEKFLTIDPVPRWIQSTGRATTFQALAGSLAHRDPGRRVLEAGADFLFREGMIVPVPLQDGSLGVVSVAGDRETLAPFERAFLEMVAVATMRRIVELDVASVKRTLDPALTRRELDCLALLVRGLGDREIATRLAIREPTVRFHLDRARRKMGASSRTHLAALAMWLGLAKL